MFFYQHHTAKYQRSASVYFIITFIILVNGGAMTTYAQNRANADHYFEAEQYFKASQIYERLLTQDSTNYEVVFQLAHCYQQLFAYQQAEKYYAEVAQHASRKFPLSLYYYAQMLNYHQKYEEAIEWYERFLALDENIPLTFIQQAEKEKQGSIEALLDISSHVEKVHLLRLPEPVNTGFQDFAPAMFQENTFMAFSSTRLKSKDKINNRSGEGFSDQYFVKEDSQQWQDISNEARFENLNTKWADASGSFTADGQYYYYTHCSATSKWCGIYVSEWKKGKWQEGKMLGVHINYNNSNNKHPSISSQGDTLFFVSDRPGGQGGSDIWKSIRNENGEWMPAINLGKNVNTTQNEISPYYSTNDSLLIFASDGRQGPGGMDLYMLNPEADGNNSPIALASPFNSSKDDCYLVFGKNRGYMTSNREGSFDIYSFQKAKGYTIRQLLLGNGSDLTSILPNQGEVFEDVIIDHLTVLHQKEENLTVMRSSGQDYLRNGSSRFVLSSDVNDILLEQLRDEQALSKGSSVLVSEQSDSDTLADNNLLISFSTHQVSDHEMVEIKGTIMHIRDSSAVATLSLYLLDENGNISKITTTNDRGEFRFINLEASSAYQIRSANVQEEEAFRLENLSVFGYGEDFSTLQFENIYFDFNQSKLRNEAKVALEQLADFYHQNPSSVIEINAFTDSTGNDVYNLQLSRERGQAAYEYLLEKGVDRSSLVFNAKGVSTAIASSNAYVSQQLNRRVEFYVTGQNIEYDSDIVTRMLRPEVTLYALSSATGMDIGEIKRLNGISGNELQAYKPIRLYQWALERAPALFYQMQVRSE